MGTHVENIQAAESAILDMGEKSVFEQLLKGRAVSPTALQFSLFQDAIKSEKQEIFIEKSPVKKCQLKRSNSVGNMSRYTKRRLTFAGFQDIKHPIKKRRRLNSMALPTKFLLGGDITDPLNLKGLTEDDAGRRLNTLNPISSPVSMSTKHTEIEVLVPPNIYDPLNLNSGEDIAFNLMSSKPRKRKCKHQHVRQSSESTIDITAGEEIKNEDVIFGETDDDSTVFDQSSEMSSSVCSCSSDQAVLTLSDQPFSSSGDQTLTLGGESVSSLDNQSVFPLGDQCDSSLAITFTSSLASDQESKTSEIHLQSSSTGADESKNHGAVGAICSIQTVITENQSVLAETNISKSHHPKLTVKLPENTRDESFIMDKIVSPVVPQGSSMVIKAVGSKETKSSVPSQCSFRFSRKRFSQERDLLFNIDFKETDKKYSEGSFPYHYRCDFGEDSRLSLFSKELFYGKEVLDIGCNVGCLAMNIAEHLEPSKVVGIDICSEIIGMARRHLESHVNTLLSKHEDFPISMASVYGPLVRITLPSSESYDTSFPNNIVFQCMNYVPDSEEEMQLHQVEYDIILCLRVVKWIHLNSGDEGLKRAFKKMFSQLRFGGHLILEFQPWSSYGKKKKLSRKVYRNYQSIQMKPSQFITYLLSAEVGFLSCKVLGFNSIGQPVFILTKGVDMNLGEDAHRSNMVSPVVFNDIEWSGCYEEEENSGSEWEENEEEDYPEGVPSFPDDAHYSYYQENQMFMDSYFVSPDCERSDEM